jgi:ribbon-helix-helix protein
MSTVRKRLDLGLRHYSRQDLEAARAAGEMLHIQVLGLAVIAADVTPELARAAIASVVVLGALHASPVVKAAPPTECHDKRSGLGPRRHSQPKRIGCVYRKPHPY